MQNEISLEKLIAGDLAEFARLVDVYSGSIYRLGLKMLGNPQAAEDVLQNTFINALMHLASFEGRFSLATWLYRIATNVGGLTSAAGGAATGCGYAGSAALTGAPTGIPFKISSA